jgi:hypothetical protein
MSVTDITSPHWRGERAAPIDPSTIRFTAQGSIGCTGCLFRSQKYTVCDAAHDIAVAAGLPPCSGDSGEFIYIIDESDPRQLQLLHADTE